MMKKYVIKVEEKTVAYMEENQEEYAADFKKFAEWLLTKPMSLEDCKMWVANSSPHAFSETGIVFMEVSNEEID